MTNSFGLFSIKNSINFIKIMKYLIHFFIVFSIFFTECKAQDVSKNEIKFSKKIKEYKTFSEDGAWCWFSDPRAVHLNNKIYSGWVSSEGSIMVASYNEITKETKEFNLYSKFNKDDHANPSFLILPDKKIMIFFSAHSKNGIDEGSIDGGISYTISTNPESISSWEPLKKIPQTFEGKKLLCYTNPIMLSEENNRIYLFWRGADWKPTFSYSDDLGINWSNPKKLLQSTKILYKRPYVKVVSNGKDEIHFAFTDGHPRNEPFNNIYYLKYKKGNFYKSNGTIIGNNSSLPLEHEDCDIVYDSHKEFLKSRNAVKSWIWDIALNEDGYPAIVYTRLPEETKHIYYYANWDGGNWQNSMISPAGSSFPRFKRNKEQRDPEPHYSGGIYLDHENTNTVYYSKPVNDIFEIFKAIKLNEKWIESSITMESKKDNVRPYSIMGADKNAKTQLLWMYNDYYQSYTDYKTKIKMDLKE
jgi:hypothetical protein|tara:strand:- start:2207 stop:3622 length:1416 start_codon:yes stop_codon:yes gene_type:complete